MTTSIRERVRAYIHHIGEPCSARMIHERTNTRYQPDVLETCMRAMARNGLLKRTHEGRTMLDDLYVLPENHTPPAHLVKRLAGTAAGRKAPVTGPAEPVPEADPEVAAAAASYARELEMEDEKETTGDDKANASDRVELRILVMRQLAEAKKRAQTPPAPELVPIEDYDIKADVLRELIDIYPAPTREVLTDILNDLTRFEEIAN